MFTNRDALPYEVSAVADAARGAYRPPCPADEPEGFAAYRRAWQEWHDRAGTASDTTAALILGALMLRRAS